MRYGFRLLDQLYLWRTWFLVIGGVLLLEGLALVLLSRRHNTSRSLRLLWIVTLALALSSALLAGYTEWQIRTLDVRLPFIRLPDDGGIQYIRPLGTSVVIWALPVLMIGTGLVVLLGGIAGAWSLMRQLNTRRQHQPPRSVLGTS